MKTGLIVAGAIPTVTIVLLVIMVIVIAITVALYFFGKKMQDRQAEQEAQMEQVAQWVNLLVIDKKKMKLKEAGLPKEVYENTPWYGKRQKVPVVKVKVGPKVMTLLCDGTVFDEIPVKKEVKAKVSGLYITAFKGAHGKLEIEKKPEKGIKGWAKRKYASLKGQLDEEKASDKKGKK